MATKTLQSLILVLFLSLLTPSFFISSSKADECVSTGDGGIAIYWGQNSDEGTLQEACATGNYKYVLLAYLELYEEPRVNFAGHCSDCTTLASDIKYCQSQSINVFLSIGGVYGYQKNATDLASYLWDNFLSGGSGPLGEVTLDGIDFTDVPGGSNLTWDELAEELSKLKEQGNFYLSAAPECPFLNDYLKNAILAHKFDYLWVEFYHNSPCEYSDEDPQKFFDSWQDWTTKIAPNSTIFLGLPASPKAASSGYIAPEVLKTQVLPTIQKDSNYGGVMLWNRYYDKESTYSDLIKDSVIISKVCTCVCQVLQGPVSGLLTQAL